MVFTSWTQRKFAFAASACSIEGVLGLLLTAVLHIVLEVYMEQLLDQIGVWWETAVLWGLGTLSIRSI